MSAPAPSKIDIRRQVERILFDLIYDEDTIIRTGTFCQVPVSDFARQHRWRPGQVKDALKDLDRLGYLSGLQFASRSASFHLVIPKAFREV